ncbi:MAG TPA: nitroreductase family protein [Burkholderiales bacterium]|nr:nitroreductase family protein [Burkholderiales bacterium]
MANPEKLSQVAQDVGALLLPDDPARAQKTEIVKLPAPSTDTGRPLMKALKLRHSSREFSNRKLPQQVLSNLLWAAFGVNRAKTHGRTAPSAHDWEEIDIYVAAADGLYVYDAHRCLLRRLQAQDIRAQTGLQSYVADAPINLVYVADLSRMAEATEEEKAYYSGPDAGFIAQNVYLYCASEGLATVVRGMVDRKALAKLMKLTPNQRVVLAQTVGYPASTR